MSDARDAEMTVADSAVLVGAAPGAIATSGGATSGGAAVRIQTASGANVHWREIDRQLRRVAQAQAALDAEELRWLALAQTAELHRELGMASMLEYVERVLGYGPKVAHERLRVARELTELPRMRAALEEGRLSFSAVRELSRKVTATSEGEWLEAVRGKCLREIEDLLSGHKKGDRPGDPIEPCLQLRKITLELTPPTMALFRDACRRLEDELGHHLTDDEIVLAMCATVLGGEAPREDGTGTNVCECVEGLQSDRTIEGDPSRRADLESGDSPPREEAGAGDSFPRGERGQSHASPREEVGSGPGPGDLSRGDDVLGTPASPDSVRRNPTPRAAPYQIALTVCPSCDRGWHDAGGRAIAVPDSTIAQAICDAQYIGRTDLVTPDRAYSEVSPATARLVRRRDRGCCRVPGCRSARWLQIHHIIWREHGGTDDPRNLVCLCFAHHQAVHQGKISVTGLAPDELVFDLRAYDLATVPTLSSLPTPTRAPAAAPASAVQRPQ
jgi:hypothetical protein